MITMLSSRSSRSATAVGDGDAVPLTWKERRTLRDIEEHLADEDPALARLLRATGMAGSDRLVRQVRRWVLTVAVTLVVLGTILDVGGFVVVGILILSMIPVLLTMVWHHFR
jgi:hypothetical protein